MKKLYEDYIRLFEDSVRKTSKETTALKDSINPLNWRDIGDLRKAIKNN